MRPPRSRIATALALLIAGGARAAAPEGGALGRAADDLAERVAEGGEPDRVAIAVSAPGAEGLAGPFATALAASLSRRGLAPLSLRGRDAGELLARAAGADRLLRVRLALSSGGSELTAVAELLLVRENFFLQRSPAAAGARLLTASAPADAAARALARPLAAPAGAPALLPLFSLPERVLALAVEQGGDAPTLLAATSGGLLRLSTGGQQLAFRAAPPPGPGAPLRAPAAALAVGEFGGGSVAWQPAGAVEAEVLAAQGAGLVPVARLAAAPLCAGGAGALYGDFAPGLPLFTDRISSRVDPGAPLRSSRLLFGAAAAPRPGRAAYAVLRDDDAVELLGPDLAPLGPPLQGVGAGFALADLDGDGEPELVASSAEPGAIDRVRVLRPLGARPVIFESPPLPGALLCAAGGDVTGDGLDDVVLAALQPTGETRLWLLTADPREGAR